MPYNKKNNKALAEKIIAVNSILTSLSPVDISNEGDTIVDLVSNVEQQIAQIDSIAQEYDAPDLRALSHWMMLNLELDEDNQEQISELINTGSFSNWLELISAILGEFNQALLPDLYNSLVKPNWLMKPSIPILKNFAKWIDTTKVSTPNEVNTDVIIIKDDKAEASSSNDTETQNEITTDESEPNNFVFEKVDKSILEKDYALELIDIVKDVKSSNQSETELPPLVVSEKTSNYYDELALKDSSNNTLSDEYHDSQTEELTATGNKNNTDELIFDGFESDNILVEDFSEDLDPNELDIIDKKDINNEDSNQLIDIDIDLTSAETKGDDDELLTLGSAETDILNQESEEVLEELDSEFNVEIVDIVMTLSTISNTATEVKPISRKIHIELDRLENLSVLFSYDEVTAVSSWCKRNIEYFSNNPTIEADQFVTTGESWGWIELVNACLTEPEEISHLSSLSTALTSDEWFEPLEVEDLQNLLLFLRNPETKDSISQEVEGNQDPQESSSSDFVNNTNETSFEASEFLLTWDDDTHPELLEAYFEETPDIVTNVKQLMIDIVAGKTSEEDRHTASRLAHTIKGGSAVLGITGLSDYAYQLEQILDYSTHHELSEQAKPLLLEASECLEKTFDAVQNKGPEPTEFSSVLTRLKEYAGTLEDDDNNLDLEAPTLPDFITNSNSETKVETVAKTTNEQDEVENFDDIDDAISETIEEIELENLSSSAKILNIDTSSIDKSSVITNHTDFSVEIDDITMSLVSICNKPDDVFNHLEEYSTELQRLELLADISGYPAVSKTSQWCLSSLNKFEKNNNDSDKQFIASGEAWSWIELVGASLSESEEISHLPALSTKLMRDEWLEPLPVETLQELLLELKFTESNDDTGIIKNTSVEDSEADVEVDAKEIEAEIEALDTDTDTVEKVPEIISWDNDIHPELLAVYFQETPDQVTDVASLLHKISKGNANKDDHQHAARIAHTIKGASGVLGIDALVNLTHMLEDILDHSVNNKLSNEASELLAEASDCLESTFEAIQNKQAIPEEYEPVLAKLTTTADSISTSDDSIELILEKPNLPDFIPTNDNDQNTKFAESTKETTISNNTIIAPLEDLIELSQSSHQAIDNNEAHIRIPLRVIDKLLNLAGELVTSSSQVSDKIDKTLATRKNIKEQDKRVHRMLHELTTTIDEQEKNQESLLANLKDSDFDSLEMDTYNELYSVVGLLTESILDSETIEESLGKQLTDLNGYLRTVDQLNKELSEVILNSRMESVNTLVPRLERIVRETCRKTNKKAELNVTGNDNTIDTDILSGLVDPLLHLLRNAVDHGIESTESRIDDDKEETGVISLDFKRQGNFIQMQLKDDGKGIDPEAIYQRAVEKGLITPDQEFSKYEILKLILQAGFTTQDDVSDISGRGVGMDVVKTAIENLKGSLEIDSQIGEGTTFSIRIPLTLVTSATILVKASDHQVAIPSDTIEQIYYLSPEKVIHRDDAHFIKHNGKEIAIQSLVKLLGWPANKVDYNQANTLIIIKENNNTHAIHIDEIINSREVVIKSLSPWIDGRNGIIGACHLPNGSVAPVLNLPLLLNLTEDTETSTTNNDAPLEDKTNSKNETPLILVVDDSLSNRKAISLIIEQTEYDVVTAVDGLDALNIMNEQHVTMVFTDLEMPRMNGLEFTQSVRAWEENKHTPVVMITSRTTSKHRQLAEKAGVNDYLTKPVVTDTLLESIKQWINQEAPISA